MIKKTIFIPTIDKDEFVNILDKYNSKNLAKSTKVLPSIDMSESKII